MGASPSSSCCYLRRLPRLGWALVLGLAFFQVGYLSNGSPGSTAFPLSHPDLMPPHPHLREAIQQGKVKAPHATPQEQGTPPHEKTNPSKTNPPEQAPSGSATPQQINVLSVLVDFNDKAGTVAPSYFDNLIFAPPQPGRGSVRDYFDEVSYGQVDLVTADTPDTWRNAGSNYASYVGSNYCIGAYPTNCQKLAETLVDALDPTVDFSRYDNDGDGEVDTLVIVHAGPGAEYTGRTSDVWSHSWSLQNPRYYDGVWISKYVIMPEYWTDPTPGDMTIGVFAHELGHGLWRLPDLYDTDYSSAGVGNWSLMGGGSWNGPFYDGSSPAWPDAWSRAQMGFITPEAITSNLSHKSIAPVTAGDPNHPNVYLLENSTLGELEYFLVENRQQTPGTYDQYLPGKGLLVWRVDEEMWWSGYDNQYECRAAPRWNCPDTRHYLVALEQADGLLDLEYNRNHGDAGDPFAAGSGLVQAFGASSTPDTSSYYGSGPSGISIDGITQNLGEPGSIVADITVGSTASDVQPALYMPVILKNYTPPPITLEEGFEGGIIPPTGWTHIQTDMDPLSSHTWRLPRASETGIIYNGDHSAFCDPHTTDPYDQQNEVLLTPPFYASEANISFYSFGFVYICGEPPNLNSCDLNLWMVYNNWGGDDDILIYKMDTDWLGTLVWTPRQIDLTPYIIPGQSVQVGFEYYSAGNGAQVGLDDITLVYQP